MSRALPSPIAIDGPSASGKSTVAAELRRVFGYLVIDTGMTYRAFTAVALDRGLQATDAGACEELARSLQLSLEDDRIFADGVDMTDELRSPEVEANVSTYSAIPAVREAMVAVQRTAGAAPCCVVVGRDIGTVVFPGAPLKFYLDASAEARAARRSKQAPAWGVRQDAGQASRDIGRRDAIDTTRTASPLRPAEDAIVIDTTDMSEAALLERVVKEVRAWGA